MFRRYPLSAIFVRNATTTVSDEDTVSLTIENFSFGGGPP